MSTWLKKWEPENEQFWQTEGRQHANRTLWITTFTLIFSFATWFVISAIVVKLPDIGFKFSKMQLFWLAAMPGLAGGTFRLIHTFLIPIYGTRHTITVSVLLKIIPMMWLGFAVQDPGTPYWQFLIIAILCGLGGGDFSSFMPSTSIHFPKRLQGYAMGIQAGIGNFGVSLTQFVTPWIIGFSLFGAIGGGPQLFTRTTEVFDIKIIRENDIVSDVYVEGPLSDFVIVERNHDNNVTDIRLLESELTKDMKVELSKNDQGIITSLSVKKTIRKHIWLQNAAFWYLPLLVVTALICWIYLRSIRIEKPSVSEMIKNMTDNKHAWFCVITYIMTFGSFSGFSASFPLMIKTIYGNIPGTDAALSPDPLKYAFLGPLTGSVIRALTGGIWDKYGGSIGVMISGVGLIAGCLILIFGGFLTPHSLSQFPMFVWIMLWIFLMTGIGNAATFRQYPIVFAFSPRQGAQILGWTGAWGAYGPFIFSSLIGSSISSWGNAKIFFYGILIFYILATWINWYYYTRKGAERFDWGTKWGTWWDSAKKLGAKTIPH